MVDIVQGDAGTAIDVSLGEDISDLSAVEFIFRDSAGDVKNLTGALKGGETEIVTYTTAADDFDLPGRWEGQVEIVQPSKTRRSTVFVIVVEKAL